MQCTVIVRPESATHFVACPLGLPQLESSAPTAAEAVEQVKQKLSLLLKGAEVVEISIPTGNPWLDTFGRSTNDPQFDEYLAELQRYRKEQEAE
ncbi:MAG: hypothetical protein EXR78_10160 [Deltaproteobacteria bacterium]|jgi:hypothetical protein|nr:hypothetical protein [Deltaproteobacteria bacterium]